MEVYLLLSYTPTCSRTEVKLRSKTKQAGVFPHQKLLAIILALSETKESHDTSVMRPR